MARPPAFLFAEARARSAERRGVARGRAAADGDTRASREPRARDARARRAPARAARASRARSALRELRDPSRAAHALTVASRPDDVLREHPSRLVLGRRGERGLVRDAGRVATGRAAEP